MTNPDKASNVRTSRSFRAIAAAFVMVAGAASPAAAETGDGAYRALFQAWKGMEAARQDKADAVTTMAVPSQRPVDTAALTSDYGVRSDPFRRSAAVHAGIDLAAPQGSAIYATADGIVARSGRAGGYGNLIELDHGQGVQTRYGHLSKLLVGEGERVKRGQLIGLMGSTGRSTGSHLHYEVRLDGHAVDPMPFMEAADVVLALRDRRGGDVQLAMGGPED